MVILFLHKVFTFTCTIFIILNPKTVFTINRILQMKKTVSGKFRNFLKSAVSISTRVRGPTKVPGYRALAILLLYTGGVGS